MLRRDSRNCLGPAEWVGLKLLLICWETMTKKRRHLTIIVIWAALLAVGAALFWDRPLPAGDTQTYPANIQADERSVETQTPSAAAGIVGRWRRGDGGYILDIKAVHDDGKIDATYLNPRPIHISKAEAVTSNGYVTVVVTLQDRGYPGNMYTLTYDTGADRLDGVYHHRGLGQQFDVEFSRLRLAQNTQE